MTEETCCTPNGQIKRYVDCKGCDRKPMTETIEQAAERYADDIGNKNGTARFDFIRGATWQSSQPNPHRITVENIVDIMALWYANKITHSRMVEILNEIAAGKHKERIEI